MVPLGGNIGRNIDTKLVSLVVIPGIETKNGIIGRDIDTKNGTIGRDIDTTLVTLVVILILNLFPEKTEHLNSITLDEVKVT